VSRKDHLERSIRESHAIIREYEETIQTSDRAEERLRAQRQIDRQWRLIEDYLKEYAPLVGNVLPPDIAEIAAYFDPTGAVPSRQELTTGVQVVQQADREYVDLEIRILRQQTDGYLVEITLNGQQEFRGYLSADVVSKVFRSDRAAAGSRLFDALFDDSDLRDAWGQAKGKEVPRHIRLWIDVDAPELHALPWEVMQEGEVMLAAGTDTPFSRYMPDDSPWGGAVAERPIRVLAVISNPQDLRERYELSPVDVGAEREILQSALAIVGEGEIKLDFLDAPVTLERLEQALREGYHVLHFVGHGAFSIRRGQAAVYLQDGDGNARLVRDEDLVRMLARLGTRPALVTLVACQSATRSTADAFAGLGPRLVSIGIPAVLAMQDAVAIETARVFEATFYKRLLAHGCVDLAANEARATLLTAGRSDADTPVLFLRLKDGQLFAPVMAGPQRLYSAQEIGAEWNRSALRELLTAAFTDGELTALCYDFYPRVYDEFGEGMGKSAKIHRLLAHCISHEKVEVLLALVRERNPAQYKHYEEGRVYAQGVTGVALSVPDQSVQETPTPREESLRDLELAYLDGLLEDYDYWREHYTPLAGIKEVRAAVQDGPRLDLPMPFVPRGFSKLIERDFGGRGEVKREQVDDLREAIREHRRIVLLGDPGSGKTTTLWRLAYEYAQAAREDEGASLPVFIPLGGYTDDSPFDAYLARQLGPLSSHLGAYLSAGRLVLLLDGLNEMPQAEYARRVGRIREVLDRYPDGMVIVTCRTLDYVIRLENLQKVEVSPLDPVRIHTFLCNYLGEVTGERLCWELAGIGEARELCDTWQGAGGTWEAFWTAEEMPENVYSETTGAQDRLWERLRQEPPQMLSLGSNPYMLLMTAQVYARAGGVLPANRATLFEAFADTLLERERERCDRAWIEAETQKDGLAALAYAMQAEGGGQGTSVGRAWALAHLCQAVPGCDAERLLYLATSATLLDTSDSIVRFYHQLLQEYFAARELGRRVNAGESLARYWPSGWWEPSGWEETFILLAGMEADASALLVKLAETNPVVAGRCLLEGGAGGDEADRRNVIEALIAAIDDQELPPAARVQAGDTLARLGDPRPGVGLRLDGLPDIVWCEVPAGSFTMSSDDADEMAFDSEKPQHEVRLPAFRIARYPVTNAQYAAFVRDRGYTTRWRACWTDDGWAWKEDRAGPDTYGGIFDLPNHPVVMVTWYEAVAFCRWLTEQLRRTGKIETGTEVALPSEAQWEKAARGTDGRIYPWGDQADPNRANYDDTGVGTTSAVGCFPGGASPYGALDMSGNVWEWCRTEWQDNYENYQDADNLEGTGRRVLRGGSFDDPRHVVRCSFRYWPSPLYVWLGYGFRLCVSPVSR